MRGAAGALILMLVAACQPLDIAPVPRAPTGEPVVAVVGDSVAWSLGFLVEPVDGVELWLGAGFGCGLDPAAIVVDGVARTEPGLPPCAQHHDIWRSAAEAADPDVVVLVLGAWEVFDRRLDDGTVLRVGTDEWRRWIDDRLDRVGNDLVAVAPHAVLAVTDVPCYDERGPDLGGAGSPRNDPEARAAVDERLAAFVARHPARAVTLPWSAWLCGADGVERPDGVHLSRDAALALWRGPLGDLVRALP